MATRTKKRPLTRPQGVKTRNWVNVADLSPNPENPRYITEDQFAKLKDSVGSFIKLLALKPLVVRKTDGIVIDGNMRLRCFQALKWDQIPTEWINWSEDILKSMGLEPMTPEEEREAIIKSNLAYGKIDWEIIFNGWEDLDRLEEWGQQIDFSQEPGVDPVKRERAEFVRHDNFDAIDTDIQPGDLITLGPHRLLCGDSTIRASWIRVLQGEKADVVLTDPPYNVDYTGGVLQERQAIENDNLPFDDAVAFAQRFIEALVDETTPGTPWYVFYGTKTQVWPYAIEKSSLNLRQGLVWLAWVKDSLTIGRQDYQWMHEGIAYTWTPGAAHKWYSDRKQSTVLDFRRPKRSELHPTMKPIDLLEYLIRNSSKPGDLVVDGFGGSGSTLMAAHIAGRRSCLIEHEPKYCQVTLDRILDYEPQTEVTINGQPYTR